MEGEAYGPTFEERLYNPRVRGLLERAAQLHLEKKDPMCGSAKGVCGTGMCKSGVEMDSSCGSRIKFFACFFLSKQPVWVHGTAGTPLGLGSGRVGGGDFLCFRCETPKIALFSKTTPSTGGGPPP